MHEEIAIGGFGGQGVMFVGRLLTEAAFKEGREVVYMPAYGAEKRGGTAWCNVTISDERIGALFISRPTVAIALHSASLTKFESTIRSSGLLVVNRTLVLETVTRNDIDAIYIPANDLAAEVGDGSIGNLVVLGALLAYRPVVSSSSVHRILEEMLVKKRKLLDMNLRALESGHSWTQTEYASQINAIKSGD
jgi:2-oxoglutarate ferredoxin oxidoreductase subunit gamma